MKKVIKTMLAFAAVLLCGGAWAADIMITNVGKIVPVAPNTSVESNQGAYPIAGLRIAADDTLGIANGDILKIKKIAIATQSGKTDTASHHLQLAGVDSAEKVENDTSMAIGTELVATYVFNDPVYVVVGPATEMKAKKEDGTDHGNFRCRLYQHQNTSQVNSLRAIATANYYAGTNYGAMYRIVAEKVPGYVAGSLDAYINKTDAQTLIQNATLADIADGWIVGKINGAWVSSDFRDLPVAPFNVTTEKEGDTITKVKLQFQLQEGKSLVKGVLAECTQSGANVVIKATNSKVDQTNEGKYGTDAENWSDGTLATAASGNSHNGYGIHELKFYKRFFAAKIDGEYYATLEEAFAAATEGQTVTLLANVTGDLTVPAGKIIDAAAYTISGEIIIEAGAKLIVSGNRTTNGISGEGELVINSGTIQAKNKSNQYAIKGTDDNGITVTINSGTLELYAGTTGVSGNADATIKNVKFVIAEAGTLYNHGWVNMEGKIEFDAEAEETVLNFNDPKFRGTPSIIKSGVGKVFFYMYADTNAKFSSLTINEGVFKTRSAITVDKRISGVDNKAVNFNSTTFEYSLVDAVAKIGTVCYATLTAALDAAIADKSLVVDILDGTTTLPDGYANTCVIVGTQAWAKREVYIKSKAPTYQLESGTATTLRTGDIIVFDNNVYPNDGGRWANAPLFTNFIGHKTIVGISMNIRGGLAVNQAIEVNAECYFYGGMANGATVSGTGTLYVGYDQNQNALGNVSISCGTFGFQPNGTTYTAKINGAVTLDSETTVSEGAAASAFVLNAATATLTVPTQLTDGKVKCGVNGMTLRKRQNDSGMWVYYLVTTPAASVGETDFTDIAAAIEAAKTANKPVVLGKNVEGALNIPGGVTIDSNGLAISDAITGSGTIIFSGSLPTNTFTSEEWRGTVWLKNIGSGNSAQLAASGIASLGNANSTVRMTNVKGYLGSAGSQTFDNAFTLEFAADESTTLGWDNRSGWGANKQTYKALAGDGDYIAASSGSSTCSEQILFTDDSSSFTGGIDVMASNKAGKIVCFGANGELVSGNDNAGTIIVGSGKTMQIAATKAWKAAKVKVIGTVKGSGTIDAALEIVDGATIDVTGNKALRLADNKNVTFGESITLVGVTEGQPVLTNVVLEPENLLFVQVTTKTTADAEGVQQGRLEYDSTAKTVIYTAAATTYWTVNPAKVNNGVFVWDATDAWLGDDGETIRSWSDAPTGTKAQIDADIVSSVVIGGQITAGEVVVVNTRGNAFAFENHTQKVDGRAEMDAATDCLHAKVNVVNFDGELGIRVAIDGAITLGSRSNIVFVTPEVEDTTTAYPYALAGRSTPIKVRGPGSFLVPEEMYADPFEIENGTLVYSVANGQTKAINGIISGQGSVQKIGVGAANFGGANTFMGGLYVDEGTAKLAVAKGFGGSDRNGLVYVAPGASIDIAAGDSTNYDIHTAGTIFSTTGIGNNSMQTRKLTLEGDTTIGGSANFGFIAYNFVEVPINIGAHTLTVDKTGNLWMVYTTVSGIGTIDVAQGTVQCYGYNNGGRGGFTMADGTLKISGGTFAVGEKNATIKNLDLSSGSITRSTGTITVTGRISGNGTTTALTLSDMCVIDLGTNSHPTFGELTLGDTFVLDAIRLENPTDGQTLVTFASEEAATDALSKASFMPPAAGWKISTSGSSIVLAQAQTRDPITQLTENITDGDDDVSIRAQGDTSIAINASGVLTIDVPADHLTLSGVISGTCQVHKTGAGTLTLSGANTFTGGLFVHEGTVVSGAGSSLSTGPIVVDTGAALNFNSNRSSVGYDVILNGGLLMGGGGNAHDRYIRSLTLLKNSYIGRTTDQGTEKCDILGLGTGSGGASSLDLNGNALTIYAGGNFYFESVTAKSAGTIRLYEGNLLTHHNAPDLSGTKLIIESGAKIEVDSSEGNSHTLIVSDLIYNGSSATEGGGTIKVTGSYTGTGNVSKLTLAAGAKIVPLEEGELNFNGAVTLGGDVHIDLTNVEAAKKIANWAAVPAGGSFVPEGRSNATVVSGADGLYTIPVSVKLPNVQVNGETVTDRFTRMEYYLLTGKTEEGYTFVPPAFVTPDQSSSNDSMSIKVALPTPLNGISGYLSLKAKSGNGVWKRIAVQKPESSGTCTFDVPFSEILKGSTKCALFSLEAETAQKPVGYDAKMLAKTPIADGACGWTTAGKVDRTTMGTGTDSGALYRIVAVAKGNGMITTMYDARSNFKDLGQAAVWNDWAGNDSFDNGNTWSPARLMIDVPNWGDSSQGAHKRKECDLIDPCLGYDANRQKFVVMGLTGGGLAGSSKVAYAGDNDLVIYERDAVDGSRWDNRTSVEEAILDALEVAMGDDGTDWTVCRGVLQGPGHAYTTPTDLVRGDITIPAGTPIFAMQYFQDFASPNYSFVAWYTIENGNMKWHTTKLTMVSGGHEPSVTVLDDGSLYMIAKAGSRWAFRSTDYVNWVRCADAGTSQSVQGSILKIGSKNGLGKYAHATCTSGRAQIKVFIGTDNSSIVNTANSAPVTWNNSEAAANVWPNDCWTQGYTTMFMVDEHTLGVIFEAQSHVYFQAVDISAYVD